MEPFRPLLLVRADANTQIGSGHVLRCAALAEAWQARGGRTRFLCADLPAGIAERLVQIGAAVTRIPSSAEWRDDVALLRQNIDQDPPAWVVLDGYSFGPTYQRDLVDRLRPTRLLCLDDSDRPQRLWCDVVLNQNVFAQPENYLSLAPADRWLGPQYVLLRSDFAQVAAGRAHGTAELSRDGGPRRTRILVTLGGGDAANGTALVLRAFETLPSQSLEVVVVLGESNPHRAALVEQARNLPVPICFEYDVRKMADLMARCDLAIAAAGTTSYELAALGVPALLIVAADNQAAVARGMAEAGAAWDLGSLPQLQPRRLAAAVQTLCDAPAQRERMAQAGRRLIDGRGAERVVERLMQATLRWRTATAADAELLYRWQQDPTVRAASFTAGPRDFAGHQAWLQHTLNDPLQAIDLYEFSAAGPVGCVRLAQEGPNATIGVLIDTAYRGRKLASAMIRQSVARWSETSPAVRTIQAWIKPTNEGSRRTFAAAGFQYRATTTHDNQPAELWEFPVLEIAASFAAGYLPCHQLGEQVHE